MSRSLKTLPATITAVILLSGCAGSGGSGGSESAATGDTPATAGAAATSSEAAPAGEPDSGAASLFINLTTDDPHRANMALKFGGDQLDRGHPLTILLNDRGVFLGSSKLATKYAEQQATLSTLKDKGATLLMCPMCAGHYQIPEADWLKVLEKSNPDLSGKLLFGPNVRSMTW